MKKSQLRKIIRESIKQLMNEQSPAFFGCMDSTAYNYNSAVNNDDGSCVWFGCMDPTDPNYDPTATVDLCTEALGNVPFVGTGTDCLSQLAAYQGQQIQSGFTPCDNYVLTPCDTSPTSHCAHQWFGQSAQQMTNFMANKSCQNPYSFQGVWDNQLVIWNNYVQTNGGSPLLIQAMEDAQNWNQITHTTHAYKIATGMSNGDANMMRKARGKAMWGRCMQTECAC